MLFIAIVALGYAYLETLATSRTRKVWVSPAVPLANNPSLVSYTKLHSAWDGRSGAADSGAEGRGSFSAAFAVGFAAALAGLRLQSGRKVALALVAGKESAHMRLTSTKSRRSALRMAAGGEGEAVAIAPAPGLLQQAAATSAYARLQGTTVTRASDGQAVELTSLWRPDLFGFGGEKVVVTFLRHFG